MNRENTLGVVRVGDVMIRNPALLGFWVPLHEAAETLANASGDAAVVTFRDGCVAGLLTERTLVFGAQALAEGGPAHVGRHLDRNFIHVDHDADLGGVMTRMARRGVRRAVVMQDEHPVGLLSFLSPAQQPFDSHDGSWSTTEADAAMAG